MTILWWPSADRTSRARVTGYLRWLGLGGYDELWAWSTGDLDGFWRSIADHFRLGLPPGPALAHGGMPGARWFPGASVSYPEQVFSHAATDRPAIVAVREDGTSSEVSWEELARQVASVAAGLRERGIGRGDRVAAYLPNIPETVVAFLATAAVGAVWSVCSPELGPATVTARFAQIKPKVLFAVDGYVFGGMRHDRRAEVAALRRALPSVEHLVHLGGSADGGIAWEEFAGQEAGLVFDRVPFDHPLWILYSSGTTGLPKAIVQGHGGILLEHLKFHGLHLDLGPGDRFLWFTTTSWMMWNVLVSGLLVGSTIVLYDGSAGHPDLGRLWRVAEEARVTFLGTGAAHLSACARDGLAIATGAELRSIGSTGSPLPAKTARWVYEHVKPDVWLTSASGGTDVCTGFVGGVPTLPVEDGAIQRRCLGADVAAYDPSGEPVTGEVGELVVRQPMPSMPLEFWNDPDGARHRAAYFERFPGVWSHGDWITIHPSGSVVLSGRSDATINKLGVRMGPADIYEAVESLDAVRDSLVVGAELGDGYLMALFVVPAPGADPGELRREISGAIRRQVSPRHVPDEIVLAPGVPRTLTGKKLEVPVKRLLQGAALGDVVNLDTVEDPEIVRWYARWARNRATREEATA